MKLKLNKLFYWTNCWVLMACSYLAVIHITFISVRITETLSLAIESIEDTQDLTHVSKK